MTIDATEVDALLTDFPVLCDTNNLPSEMFDADGSYPAQSNGGDIRFSSDSAGSTQLACEVVDFSTDNDPANGTAQIWVKVPSVSSSVDTTIYVWWNTAGTDSQPSASDTYGSENVWDSDFECVYHLESLSALDSTSNGRDGTNVNGAIAAAQVQDGFDCTGDRIDLVTADYGISAGYTVECWAAWTVTTTQHLVSADSGTTNERIWQFRKESGRVRFLRFNASGSVVTNYLSTGTGWNDGSYHHIAAKFSTANGSDIFVDGASDGTDSNTEANESTTGTKPSIGSRSAGSSSGALTGMIDEVRISSVERSDAWCAATYSTANAPGTFASAGTPATPGGGGGSGRKGAFNSVFAGSFGGPI